MTEKILRIYLDNCCYNRPYDDQSQIRISLEAQAKIFIQNAVRCVDILPTPKGGGFCYQQPMLKNLSLTRSPARVDAPTHYGI